MAPLFFHKIVGIVHLLLHFKCIESRLKMNIKCTWQGGAGLWEGKKHSPTQC